MANKIFTGLLALYALFFLLLADAIRILGENDIQVVTQTPAPTQVPLAAQFGFPTPTPTRTLQLDEWSRIRASINYEWAQTNKLRPSPNGPCRGCPSPAIGSIKDGRCQGQTHDTSLFGIDYGPSKYAYVLELDRTLHICTDAGELIY